jgi:hypothetical protein
MAKRRTLITSLLREGTPSAAWPAEEGHAWKARIKYYSKIISFSQSLINKLASLSHRVFPRSSWEELNT